MHRTASASSQVQRITEENKSIFLTLIFLANKYKI